MYEVEVKVRADHEAVRERIEALDGRFRARVIQEDAYYDAPHRAFAETDEALRIRRESVAETGATRGAEPDGGDGAGANGGETTVFTYKGPLVDSASKTRREIEVDVGDSESLHEILAALDFSPAATVRKERSVYTLADSDADSDADASDDVTVVLDRVAEIGEFLEVELDASDDEIDATRERTHGVLRDLGLNPENQLRTSYLELILDESENAGEITE